MINSQPPRLVLASTSKFRQALLRQLQIPFECAAPNIDESHRLNESASELVARLALEKAQAVQAHYPQALIIGSDQVAVLNGQILGKPHTHANATAQLQASSNQYVEFLTGLCLFNSNTQTYQLDVVHFGVKFRPLSESMIEYYLQREQPYECAGSFKSEGLGVVLFEKMLGDDPSALIGLPLIRLTDFLQQQGIVLPLAI
ncbi:Maf family protein [Thiofilum flexile]|uniref:Maf family protein n=1 Tax=Thiofilum flexile TaxID=125627 RepID=UPI00037C60EF|nr:nucleoside triphosphate pyrophosphatase [Thiofilum flexile]